jgi:hypothetical protein
MKKLSKEQAIVITGFTGKLACQFVDFHSDVEKRLGHPAWTHQFGDKEFMEKVQELYRKDFLEMLGDEE